MKKEKKRGRVPNDLITFQVTGHLNETLRNTAWAERKSLSELIRELCATGLKERPSEAQQASK
jgi:hypothetical protein